MTHVAPGRKEKVRGLVSPELWIYLQTWEATKSPQPAAGQQSHRSPKRGAPSIIRQPWGRWERHSSHPEPHQVTSGVHLRETRDTPTSLLHPSVHLWRTLAVCQALYWASQEIQRWAGCTAILNVLESNGWDEHRKRRCECWKNIKGQTRDTWQGTGRALRRCGRQKPWPSQTCWSLGSDRWGPIEVAAQAQGGRQELGARSGERDDAARFSATRQGRQNCRSETWMFENGGESLPNFSFKRKKQFIK